MADRRRYDASALDWAALRARARQAATNTPVPRNPPLRYRDGARVVEVMGEHWLLDVRNHHIRKTYRGTGSNRATKSDEEIHERHLYALLPDGTLTFVVVTTEDVTVTENGVWRSFRSHTEQYAPEFDETHAVMFDFEEKRTHFAESWGNRDRSDVLLVDTKGAGLTTALDDLSAGRRDSLQSPLPALETPATPPSSPTSGGSGGSSGGGHVDTTPDFLAIAGTVALAVTVLAPFLIGHFLMTRTFVLKPDPAVYAPQVRGITDHFLATYLAGLLPIVVLLGAYLVGRQPWQGRTASVVVGCVALIGSAFVLLPAAKSEWRDAEQATAAKLRDTAFPFSNQFLTCGSWTINAENGIHQPELWQIYFAETSGTQPKGCNRVVVYRGWQHVGEYGLPDGDEFTRDIVVNHAGWNEPFRGSGTGDIWQQNQRTGVRTAMNPRATNVDLATTSGRVLDFNLDAAGNNGFDLH